MKNLFYSVLILHILFFISCSGNVTSQKEKETSIELKNDSDSLTVFDFSGDWSWSLNYNEIIVSMKIFSDKDSIGDYVYTYYFGNRIEQGYVKLLSQDGRNAVFLVGDDYADRPWSAKFNATMLTDTTFFLTRQDHEDYRLEDSIVMTKGYPERGAAEVRKIIEDYKRENGYIM